MESHIWLAADGFLGYDWPVSAAEFGRLVVRTDTAPAAEARLRI